MKKLALVTVVVLVAGVINLAAAVQTDSATLKEKIDNLPVMKKEIIEVDESLITLFRKVSIAVNLEKAEKIVSEEQGKPYRYIDSAIASYFKVPTSIIDLAREVVNDKGIDEIPTASLLITTKGDVTQKNLDTLRENGYKITGSFGKFVQVEVALDVLISGITGLQTLDFVVHSMLPLENMHN